MRNAFIETLCEIAAADERIMLLTADLGFTVVERFAERFPQRFINVGVAEQNMLGVATGLAQVGFVPFCYSIATFATMRCYEQIRNGPALHGLPVRIVGIGGGYAYGHAGPTHFALEDLSILRAQPGVTVVAPADPLQTRSALQASQGVAGPIYFRVGKGQNQEVPGLGGRFTFGRPELVREGRDVLFVTTGDGALEALGAAQILARDEGIEAAIAVMAHLPLRPSPELSRLVAGFSRIVTAEEGTVAGGLGDLVAQAIVESGLGARMKAVGVDRPFSSRSGGRGFMQAQVGLDVAGLARAARELVGKERLRG